MQSLRRFLLCLALAASFPVVAVADDVAIEKGFQIMHEAADEQTYFRGAQRIIALGPKILPNLTQRLVSANDDDARIEITFLIANVLGPSIMTDETIDLPQELVAELAALMAQPRETALEGNLANLAAYIDPQPAEIVQGLLSILSRAEHEGLRATTSAVIATRSGPETLQLVHDALRRSDSDRYSGDLAFILRGTELPQDVAGILQALLSSDNAEARQSASRTLDDAGISDPRQLDAALRDLEQADTDMELLNAAMAVRKHTDGSQRVAQALASSLGDAARIEERMEIIRALGRSGQAGLDQIHATIRSTENPELLAQYILAMNSTPEIRENPQTLALLIELATNSDNPKVADAAALGLNSHGQAAAAAIDEVIADEKTDEATRERLSPIRDRLAN
jgi:hypothetical protein